MEPVGCDQAQPDPDSTHKGKQQGADLIPIKPNGNPGGKDNKKKPLQSLPRCSGEIIQVCLRLPRQWWHKSGVWFRQSLVQAELFPFCRRCCRSKLPCLDPFPVLFLFSQQLCCAFLGVNSSSFTCGEGR